MKEHTLTIDKEQKSVNNNQVSVTIDGREIVATENQSILQTALEAKIYIPHLCAHPDLEPQGGCNLCVVEVEGKGVVHACETIVEDGMKVTTKSDDIGHRRTVAMELMLAGHPHDCTSCKAYLKCELQALMQYTGAVHGRFRDVDKKATTINNKNPLIVRELERCIQCGRCVRACSDLRGVGILDYNKLDCEVYIGTEDDKPLKDAGCRFCGACIEVCPTGALQDVSGIFRDDIARSKALVPCQAECPAHIDIPAYIRAINEGDYSKAVAIIREKVPFPHSLGYVCNNRCEVGCKRDKLNSPVSIRNLKRFAVENDRDKIWKDKGFRKDRTGKKVAIVGAGAAGLTSAYYLNKLGHDVKVFEKQKIAGGHMTGGMPEYRIPTEDVLEEVKYITDSGVELECNSNITNVKELKKDYDAVLVAIGTSYGKKLNLKGSDYDNAYTAIDMLRASRYKTDINLGKKCCVIGGGNVAFDVASTLIRMGVEAHIVCLEKDASQASREEYDLAIAEGVIVHDLHSNEEIEGTKEKITGLRVHKINSFSFDPETRALIEDVVEDSSYTIECDSVVFAAGQITGLTEEFGLELNKFAYPINPETGVSEFKTSIDGVFAAGDVITGTRFLIDAIASAREVTSTIDKYLGGTGEIEETLVDRTRNQNIGKIDNFSELQRKELKEISVEDRIKNFNPVTLSFTCQEAICESSRCLQCDLRTDITKVKLWTEYN